LAGLVLFQAGLQHWWMRHDWRPPAWDESHHLRIAIEYHDAFAEGRWGRVFEPVYSNYPPFFHLVLMPFLPAMPPLGDGRRDNYDTLELFDAASAVNILFLVVLVSSLYLIGRMYLSIIPSCVAAVICSSYVVNLYLMRRPMIDFALTAWVSLFYLALLRSHHFRYKRWSVAAGVIGALGLLIKWSFIIYTGLPCAYLVWRGWQERHRRHILLFAGIGLLLSGAWYVFNFVPSLLRVTKLSSLVEGGDPDRWSLSGLTWYVRFLYTHQIMAPMFVALLVGAVECVRRKHWMLIAWVATPLLVFSLLQNKDLRYMMPALPAIALISVMWGFKRPRIWWAVCGVMGFLIGVYFQTGWAGQTAFSRWTEKVHAATQDPPQPVNWYVHDIVRYIAQHRPEDRTGTHVTLMANHPYFQVGGFRLATRLKGYRDIYWKAYKRRLGDWTEFVLFKTGNLGPEYTLGKIVEARQILAAPPDWFVKTFQPVQRWPLPDGSEAVLYQRKVQKAALPAILGEFKIELGHFPLPGFEAEGIGLQLVPQSPEATAQGEFASVLLECQKLTYKGIEIQQMRLECDQVHLNLPKLLEEKDLSLFNVREVRPRATLPASTVESFLAKKAKWLESPRVLLDHGEIFIRGRVGLIVLSARARVALINEGKAVRVELKRVSILGLPLPLFFVRSLTGKTFSLEPGSDLPFRVRVDRLAVEDGMIRIEG